MSSSVLSRFQNYVLSETYVELQPIIFRIIHKFHSRYGIPLEDLVPVAHKSFVRSCMRYDRTKGTALSSWVYQKLWGDLMDFTRTETRWRRHHASLEELVSDIEERASRVETLLPKTHPDTFMTELKDRLSANAQVVVKIVLESPKAFSKKCAKKNVRTSSALKRALQAYLREMGWQSSKIKQTFEELIETLQPEKPEPENEDRVRRRMHRLKMKRQHPILRDMGMSKDKVRFLIHDGA